MARTNNSKDVSNTHALTVDSSSYRAAFPSYRVFIYGHDITNDVSSVRINHSGGSLERSTSTCSISLVNNFDKYLWTHDDIIDITNSKKKIALDWDLFYESYYQPNNTGYDSYNAFLGGPKVDSSGNAYINNKSSVMKALDKGGPSLSNEFINEFVPLLAQASPEEIMYLLRKLSASFSNLSLSEAQAIASKIKEYKVNSDTNYAFFFQNFVEDGFDYNIKDEIKNKKLTHTVTFKKFTSDNTFITQENRVAFDYFMQEGDCIFHCNDPVRVAFRDPFDARVWYWMFTGFVDSCTENVGVNLDSEIIINCTDVTKVARYATIQMNTGLLDPNIDWIFEGLTNQQGDNAANIGVLGVKQPFEGLSVPEILEVLFFGSESSSNLVEYMATSLFELLKLLSADELIAYSINNLGVKPSEAYDKIKGTLVSMHSSSNSYNFVKERVHKTFTEGVIERLNDLNWPGLRQPRGIPFKRQNSKIGIHYYVFGEPSPTDLAFNAKRVDNLFVWNEILHHRVSSDDLETMKIDNTSVDGSIEYIDKGNDNKLSYSDVSSMRQHLTAEQIIYKIGTDLENYPVGYNRVFYFTPAGLIEAVGNVLIDRTPGGVSLANSIFKDRLTFLYDVAGNMDWRFYATPKGDLVFEMPFYDYDPQDFWYRDTNTTEDTSLVLKNYNELFDKNYDGKYDQESLLRLSSFVYSSEDERAITPIKATFNYEEAFKIKINDQLGYSNTMSDQGLINVYTAKPHIIAGLSELTNGIPQKFCYAVEKSLIPTLGVRVFDGGLLYGYVDTKEAAELFCALEINKKNAEARNIGISTLPNFGLMVNRPIHWQRRNYCANIVSLSHSIVWNSDVSTSINVNNVRGWSGESDERGNPLYKHFGDTNRPFNLVNILVKAREKHRASLAENELNSMKPVK
jgi:hypothetical protein